MSRQLLDSMWIQLCEDGDGSIIDDILKDIVDILTFNGHEYSTNAGDNYFGWFRQNKDPFKIQDDINTAVLLFDGSGLPPCIDNRK